MELLIEKCIKPLMHEGCEMLWTRCNAAKSINFQLSHAPESSIIRFISGLLIFFIQEVCLTHAPRMKNVNGCGRKDAMRF